MEPLVIGVLATDDRLPDFYGPLTSRLEGRGSVYVPHVVIPPNARIAVHRPPRLVVGLTSPDDVAELEAWADEYLGPSGPPSGVPAPAEASELHFERAGRRVVLRAGDSTSRRGSLRSLVSD